MGRTAHDLFRDAFGTDDDGAIRSNFMTPDVIWRRMLGCYAVELSTGSGFEPGSRIYGVTVLTADGERTEGLSGCFTFRDEAESYVAAIEEGR